MSEVDPTRYVPAVRRKVGDGWRYVRLTDEPMHANVVLPWLEEHGFVKRVPDPHPESETGYRLQGWGTTYFAVPFDKAVPR